jgi:hypothetical protein
MNAARIGTFAAGVVLGEQHLHRGNQFARPPVRHGDRIVIAELDNIGWREATEMTDVS